ncbi:MAG: ribonuclease III [Chloroflexi bacterium]|nr:ribonuclease III [Chloroflexota bacterium]
MDERKEGLNALAQRLHVSFGNWAILEEALTHSSFVNENPESGAKDNQRLEFLGDALLGFAVGDWLFRHYPEAQEGELTSLRAWIVCTESLAGIAREFALGDYLRLGHGEAASGGAERPANLCAAFEAVVGAIYLDRGLEEAVRWVHRLLDRRAQEIEAQRWRKNAKSLLQEYTQAVLHITPSYRIVREEGPDHAKVFTAQVLVGDEVWGEGTGPSKQAAQQAAAEAAYAHRVTEK